MQHYYRYEIYGPTTIVETTTAIQWAEADEPSALSLFYGGK